MEQYIIGISGPKGAGKTFLAREIAARLGSTPRSFAGPLKVACAEIFNLSREQLYGEEKEVIDPRWGMTPREIMQRLGTEVGREFMDDLWIRSLFAHVDAYPLLNFVIDDVRFKNEAQAIADRGGVVLRLEREGVGYDTSHTSESEMLEDWGGLITATIEVEPMGVMWPKVRRVLREQYKRVNLLSLSKQVNSDD